MARAPDSSSCSSTTADPAEGPCNDITASCTPHRAVRSDRSQSTRAKDIRVPPRRQRRSSRAIGQRVLSLASGIVLAGIGATFAMAGVVATAYADGWSPSSTASVPARTTASLSHDRTLSYPLAQVWPTTLRYLRVDRGYTLVDRDAEAGYVLFDFPLGRPGDAEGGVARGSIEMFSTEDMSGRPSVHVQVSTDAGPSHLPHAI
ncbi:MAG: hypothetical protein JKY37_04635, partial [Nannocystaceae bacterium]|nr:hypothetical protein [Nannocystaceae bacterium]